MSGLALVRLLTAGTRASRRRLLGIVAGVAVGLMLFLLLWGASEGLAARSARSTWTDLRSPAVVAGEAAPQYLGPGTTLAADEMAAVRTDGHFDGHTIVRVDVAAGEDAGGLPGVPTLPGPGRYVASPALQRLIVAHPADQLGDRFGRSAGTITSAGLEGPDALVVVVGRSPASLPRDGTAVVATSFAGAAYASDNYRIVAIIGAIAVLVPVLLLIAIVTDLGSAERAERFAVLRLLGARPGRVAGIAAAETGVTSLVGAVAGIGLYVAAVPLAARVRLGSGAFYPADLLVSPLTLAVAALVTVAAATAVAWWRTLRAGIGPLGASRERRERRPRARSLVPLLLGLVLLAATVAASFLSGRGEMPPLLESTLARLAGPLLVCGFVLTAVGLLVAGPLVTRWAAGLAARRARSAEGVIALARIRAHPRAAFRAVSGLVIAVYVVSAFAAFMTTAGASAGGGEARVPDSTVTAPLAGEADATYEARSAAAAVGAVDGVRSVVVAGRDPVEGVVLAADDARRLGLPVPADARSVRVSGYFFRGGELRMRASDRDAATLPPALMIATTDGSTAAVERARTAMLRSGAPLLGSPTTASDRAGAGAETQVRQFASLAYLGILIATLISAVSLLVSTISGVLERRRVLGLLRLAGMPAAGLKRILVFEAGLPVLTVFAGCIGLGFFTAWTVLAGLTSGRRGIGWPEPGYYGILAVCFALAAAAVVATFATARRSTGIAATRFE